MRRWTRQIGRLATTDMAPPAPPDDPARAVRYARTREALFVVGLLWGWLTETLFLASGGSARLRTAARRLGGGRDWATDALYTIFYSLISLVAGLPLAYLRGYTVEHRFGMSNQSRRDWLTEVGKGAALNLALGTPLTVGSYAVIRRSPRWWWLILSALALPFTVLMAQLYPVVIAPIFNKFTPVDDPVLRERVTGLAERAGVAVAEVTRMDMSKQTRKANAFFAGLGPTKRIALGDTLIDTFTVDEIEVIVAHELGHQVHRDIWKSVALGTLSTLGGAFMLSRLVEPVAARFRDRLGFDRLADPASAPLLGLLLSVLSMLALPFANAFSRRFVERPADRYALDLTANPTAFISGMEKLGRLNLADPNPPWLVRMLLYSHPPIAERVAMARERQGSTTSQVH
jgi:STE24 endopeptidase